MQTFLFNPWNDLALAANDPHYTPPASARQMAQDLCDLPRLWASQDPRPVSVWGWSPLLVSQLRDMGIDESLLPTTEQMAAYRAASSRQTSVRLLVQLRERWPEAFAEGTLVGESTWCSSVDEVLAAIQRYGGAAMQKAPWSGSGRGVHPVHGGASDKDEAWARRTIARQGGVEVEPIYNKVVDFAVEYWSEEGHVRDEGLSLFTTTAGGVYSGNLVASEEEKRHRLAAYIPCELLDETRCRLVALLNDAFRDGLLPAWYTGPFGIDMMIVKPFNSQFSIFNFLLHPFLELNLRMTMGYIALQLAKELPPQETRLFRIVQQGGRYRFVV